MHQVCISMTATSPPQTHTLGAIFLSLPRYLSEGHTLAANNGSAPALLAALRAKNWAWTPPDVPPMAACHLVGGDTYPACIRTGRFWIDTPDDRAGCRSLHDMVMLYSLEALVWDMERFRRDPFCLRHSEEMYGNFKAE